ncbi:Hsp70 family protein [Cryptosporangium minutisporangium]|uniref:Hsp70 family protein n=1 Tax=Cryptosporangium minutisporangium TaxID=113569 RepID=UPI0031EED4C1
MDSYRLGVDFGTSSTVAVLLSADGRVRPLLFDSSPLLSSAVFLGPDGTPLTGADAERAGLGYASGLEPNPKRRIDDGTVWLGEREIGVVDVIGVVLRRVAEEAYRVTGGPPAKIVLTHPAAWGQARLGVLTAAAERAGLGRVELVPEPVAAAAYFVQVLGHQLAGGRCLVVYDLGAGTFDVSVVRPVGAGFEVVASAGLSDVGGLDLDAAVVAHARGLTSGASDAWAQLDWPQTPADQQARHALWRGAKAAKEQLSRHPATDLHVPLVNTGVRLTREEFEKLATPLLDRTSALTLSVLRTAGIAPEQVGGVFLVGGSSRIPLAATLLHRTLRIAPTALDYPELVVAEGSLRAVTAAAPTVVELPTEVLSPGPSAPGSPAGPPTQVLPPAATATLPSSPQAPPTQSFTPSRPESPPVSGAPVPSVPVSGGPGAPVSGGPGFPVSGGPGTPVGPGSPMAPGSPISPGPPFYPGPPMGPGTPHAGPVAPAPRPTGVPRRRLALLLGGVAAVVVALVLTLVILKPWSTPLTDKPLTGATLAATLTGHQDEVSAIAFHPDSTLLASASADKTIRFWDVEKREESGQPLRSFTYGVDRVVFEPTEGTRVASLSNHEARVWDVENRRAETEDLDNEDTYTRAITFSTDGKKVFALDETTTVRRWAASGDGKLEYRADRVSGTTSTLSYYALSPDGSRVAAINDGLRVYDVETSKPITGVLEPENPDSFSFDRMEFSSNGKLLAVGDNVNNTVVLFDVERGRALGADLTGHSEDIDELAFSPDGKYLASAGADAIRLWDVQGRRAIGKPLTGHKDEVTDLAFSADGKYLASASADKDKTIKLWSLARGD